MTYRCSAADRTLVEERGRRDSQTTIPCESHGGKVANPRGDRIGQEYRYSSRLVKPTTRRGVLAEGKREEGIARAAIVEDQVKRFDDGGRGCLG